MKRDAILSVGDDFDGYVILSLLGRGGMGEVYKARDVGLNRDVALKLVELTPMFDEDMQTRFEREVSVLSRMNHPNVVEFYSSGERDGLVYLVQECVEGANLLAIIKSFGQLSAERTVHIGKKILEGLTHIHRAGIIHRDMKPSNVMVTGDGDVKIMDFGLVLDGDATRLTMTGSVVGTLGYIPPELLEGDEYSPAVDLYQVGCILYEALVGEMLVNDSSFIEAGFVRLRQRLESLEDLPKKLPTGLRGVLRKSLSPRVSRRYQRAEDMLADLDRVAQTMVGVQRVRATLAQRVTELTSEALPDSLVKEARKAKKPLQTIKEQAVEGSGEKPRSGLSVRRFLVPFVVCLFLAVLVFLFCRSTESIKIEGFDYRASPRSLQLQWFSPTTDEPMKWRLEKDGKVVQQGKVECQRKRYALLIEGRRPGDRYSFVIERPGLAPFIQIVATPDLQVQGVPVVTRKYQKPNVEFSVLFRLTHSVKTQLVLGRDKKLDAEKSRTPIFDFTRPFEAQSSSDKLRYVLQSGKTVIARGCLGLGPVTRFQSFRGQTDTPRFQSERYGDRYRGIADYMAPYRFTSPPVIASGFLYLGDRNGYVYCLDKNSFELIWACRLRDGHHKRRPRSWILAPASDEILYVLTTDTNLAKVHRLNGRLRRELWRISEGADRRRKLSDSRSMAFPLKNADEWTQLATLPNDATNEVPHVSLSSGDCLVYRKRFLWRYSLFDLKIRWTVPTKAFADNIVSLPMIVGNTAYIVGRTIKKKVVKEVLAAFNLEDGHMKWLRTLAQTSLHIRPSPPTVAKDGMIYVCSGHSLFCFDPAGNEQTPDGGPLKKWRQKFSSFALGYPCVSKDKVAFYLAEQKMNFGTDMYRIDLACMDLDVEGKGVPGRLRKHPLKSFDFRHPTFHDVFAPFVDGGIVNFGYANTLYGLDWDRWRIVHRSPIQGRVFSPPQKTDEGGYFFATLEGYIHSLAPVVTIDKSNK